jgi:hypothetical protein
MKDPNIFSWAAFRRIAEDPVNRRAMQVAAHQWRDGHDDPGYTNAEGRIFCAAFEAGWNAAHAFMSLETILPPETKADLAAASKAGAEAAERFREDPS